MKPRFAIAGAGNIAGVHALAISKIDTAELVAVGSRTEGRAKALAEKYGAEWTTDMNELVRRNDVDIVNICTPSGAHRDICIAAAEAGKHVIVEKPLEVTLPRIDDMLAACRKAGVKLSGIFPSRTRAGVAKLKAAIDAGRLGRLTLCDTYIKWHRTQEYYDAGGWRGTWELDGGGALMNQSIHNIDLLQYLVGEVQEVFAFTKALAHRMETEDTAAAVLRFANGALGVIEGATSTWPGLPGRVEISGDQGTVLLEDAVITRWDLADADDAEKNAMLNLEQAEGSGSSDPMGISYGGHLQQIQDMIEAVENDRPPLLNGAGARPAVEIIRAIYLSAERGEKVSLPIV